ncbi:MAG: Zn-ribbon domain-containing OB-fold protein [Micromonosporaceae bacterium]
MSSQNPQPRPWDDLRPVSVIRKATDTGPAQLVGSRCRGCDARSVPARTVCFSCLSEDCEELLLGPDGTLYSHATVHVSATRQTPYTIGYVDLPEGPRVLAQLAGDPARLTPDDPVRLTVDDDGEWRFAAVTTGGEA